MFSNCFKKLATACSCQGKVCGCCDVNQDGAINGQDAVHLAWKGYDWWLQIRPNAIQSIDILLSMVTVLKTSIELIQVLDTTKSISGLDASLNLLKQVELSLEMAKKLLSDDAALLSKVNENFQKYIVTLPAVQEQIKNFQEIAKTLDFNQDSKLGLGDLKLITDKIKEINTLFKRLLTIVNAFFTPGELSKDAVESKEVKEVELEVVAKSPDILPPASANRIEAVHKQLQLVQDLDACAGLECGSDGSALKP